MNSMLIGVAIFLLGFSIGWYLLTYIVGEILKRIAFIYEDGDVEKVIHKIRVIKHILGDK